MSQWTHVCGCIRVDAIRGIEPNCEKKIKEALGRIVNYGDESYETIIPCGSEGSLEYHIIENPDPYSLAAFTVPIWGDLRDYDDVEEIKQWFKSACDKLFVRNAVINIEVEYGEDIAYIYHKDDNK